MSRSPAWDKPRAHRTAQYSDTLLVDYVIDAHSGAFVKEISRVATQAVEVTATDALGKKRTIVVEHLSDGPPAQRQLIDSTRNVQTFDFGFRSVVLQRAELPGQPVSNPPPEWDAQAVSAHANATVVAGFLRDVLQRGGVDNKGSALRSSINCVHNPFTNNIWRNAAWYRDQIVYGQYPVRKKKLRTVASALDVVAHEIWHGVTASSARLEYADMPGALNESYSDIFGVIIANYGEDNIGRWRWEIGDKLSEAGGPLRDLSRPARFGQPEHMSQYRTRTGTADENNDHGFVHANSGIHNLAAHRIMAARNQAGFVFDKKTVAILFYLALTQYLAATSTFCDSRRAMELVALTLFRSDAVDVRKARLEAIAHAFASVGISPAPLSGSGEVGKPIASP